MSSKSIRCEDLVNVVLQGNHDEIISLISEVGFDPDGCGWIGGDLFECLVRAWNLVCNKPAGAYPVLMWFGRSFRKFEPDRKAFVRKMIVDSYGGIIDFQTALEVAEWFGCFVDNESLEFLAHWLDRWGSMTPEAQKGLDGFFWEAFELLEAQPDASHFEKLVALEARYDKLRPPLPGVPPRHGAGGIRLT